MKGDLLFKKQNILHTVFLTFKQKLNELERCEKGFERHFINIYGYQLNKIRLYVMGIKREGLQSDLFIFSVVMLA